MKCRTASDASRAKPLAQQALSTSTSLNPHAPPLNITPEVEASLGASSAH